MMHQVLGSTGHGALNRNPGPEYPTLAIDPRRSFKCIDHRQFHTLPSHLQSRVAFPKFYPNACLQCREAVCTILGCFFV